MFSNDMFKYTWHPIWIRNIFKCGVPHPRTTPTLHLYAFFQYFDEKILEIFLKIFFLQKLTKKSLNEGWGNCGSVDIVEH